MGAFGGLQRVLIQPYAGVEVAWKTLPPLLQVEALIRLQFDCEHAGIFVFHICIS